jgi:thiol-disulfide isomerase/thioredoxin
MRTVGARLLDREVVLLTVLVASTCWSLVVTLRYHALANNPPAASLRLRTGQKVRHVGGIDDTGLTRSFSFPTKRQVLVLFTSEFCGYCDKQWPSWTGILTRVQNSKAAPQVILVSHQKLSAEYVQKHITDIEKIVLPQPDGLTTLDLALINTP